MNKINGLIFFIVIIVLSIALRFYLVQKPGYTFDLGQFTKWSTAINQNGFWDLYSSKNVAAVDNYPPVIPLTSSWAQRIAPSGADQKFVFKIYTTIFELVILVLSILVVFRSKAKYKTALMAIIALSPSLALVTTAWGQAESIFVLLIFLAFWLYEKFPYLSTVLIAASVLTKPQALPAVAIYFLVLLFRKGFKSALVQAILFLLIFGGLEALFRFKGGISLIGLIFGSVGFYTNVSLNAFNIWWLVHGVNTWTIPDFSGEIITYKTLGFTLLTLFAVPAIIYLKDKAKTFPQIMLALAYIYLVFFIFPTEIHERYLYPAVVFFAIAAVEDKKLFWIYIILSVTFLINIYAVIESVYPQFHFILSSQNLLASPITQWVSAVNVLVTIYLALYFLIEDFK